jgi:hypothetical protein
MISDSRCCCRKRTKKNLLTDFLIFDRRVTDELN